MPKTPVFVSWSGPVAQSVASSLCGWIKKVLPVEPWHSVDTEAGDAWFSTIMEKLTASSVGIVVVTPDNYANPWLLFEAGAIAKSVGRPKVITYYVGLKPTDIESPLTKFQGKMADEDGTFDVIRTISTALPPDDRHSEADLRETFDVWWPKLKAKLDAVPRPVKPLKKRPTDDMVEEVLTIVRRMDEALQVGTLSELDAWIRKNAKAAAGPTQIPLEGVNKAPEPLVLPAATLKRTWNVTTEGGKHLANVQATDAEAARAYAYSTFGVSKDERLIVTRTRIPR